MTPCIQEDTNPETMVRMTGLQQEIARLSEELQEVLILYYFQEFQIKEIAKILGISVSLVKYRLGEGKKKLREELGEEESYEWC